MIWGYHYDSGNPHIWPTKTGHPTDLCWGLGGSSYHHANWNRFAASGFGSFILHPSWYVKAEWYMKDETLMYEGWTGRFFIYNWSRLANGILALSTRFTVGAPTWVPTHRHQSGDFWWQWRNILGWIICGDNWGIYWRNIVIGFKQLGFNQCEPLVVQPCWKSLNIHH